MPLLSAANTRLTFWDGVYGSPEYDTGDRTLRHALQESEHSHAVGLSTCCSIREHPSDTVEAAVRSTTAYCSHRRTRDRTPPSAKPVASQLPQSSDRRSEPSVTSESRESTRWRLRATCPAACSSMLHICALHLPSYLPHAAHGPQNPSPHGTHH
jgi:hypothetical protein